MAIEDGRRENIFGDPETATRLWPPPAVGGHEYLARLDRFLTG
jgi:hypothetical protein